MREEYSSELTSQGSSLVVGWNQDSGKLGARVIDYLNKKLTGQELSKIELHRFFSFSGAAVENNVIQFPECRFYTCRNFNLRIFKGDPPQREWYRFLNLIIEGAEAHGKVKELYTIGGMGSVVAHTLPRTLFAVFSSLEMKKRLSTYCLEREIDYQTPSSQRPTLNSCLLWVAHRKNMAGVNLWVGIPFYLLTVGDAHAQRVVLEFFNQRFALGIDLRDLDEEIRNQNEKIAHARVHYPEIDESINKLERNLSLSEEENATLIKKVEEIFTTSK